MNERQNDNKMTWTTNLRVVATISVIFVHITAEILYQYGHISSFIWWTGNVYDSLARFCVPAFVMLTGVLMLSRLYELNDFLKKRFSRIVLPFLFWSFIYAMVALRDKILAGDVMSFLETIKWLANLLRNNGISFHLWYIYMIIGIYLFIPIISKWVQNATEKEILYFILIWIFTLFINQPILSEFRINIDLTYFSGFLGYLVLGYYLSIKSFTYSKKMINLFSILLIVIGVSITIFGTYFLSLQNNSFQEYFYNYTNLNVLVASVGVFLFFKNLEISNLLVLRISTFISKYSYGIYLVHILVLRFMGTMKINYNFINPIFAIPFATLICLLISTLIIYCINKLPYGKYISG
jgi:surface polysaccharide O-acyltransferase-like enzyme